MKVHILLTDDQGRVFEGEATLVASSARRSGPGKVAIVARPTRHARAALDFGLHARPFMKRLGGNLGGPQKFTLLLAHMVKGKAGVAVAMDNIKRQWSRMKGPMGGDFYTMYGTRAKDAGWVDTPKNGHYALRANWADALERK